VKTVADNYAQTLVMLLIITRTANKLSRGFNIDDIERYLEI